MKWEHISTMVLVTIVLLPAYLLRVKIGGVPSTVLELMILTTLLAAVVVSCSSAVSSRPKWKDLAATIPSKWLISLSLLLLAATISLFIAPNKLAALGIYRAYFLEPVAFAVLVLFLLQQKHLTTAQIYEAIGLSALFVSVVGIIQWFLPSTIPIPWDIERRITSVFEYPNSVGLYLAPIVTIAWINVTKLTSLKPGNRSPLRLLLWPSLAVFGTLAMILAQSEAALVALIATYLIHLFFNKFTRPFFYVLGFLGLVATLTQPHLQQKLTLQDYSGGVRLSQWSETWEMLKDRPVFGAGLSGYPEALIPFHQAKHLEIFQYPHNIVLNIWSELGLLGLIGLLLLIVAFFLHADARRSLAAFALLTILIHGLVDVPYFKNDLAILTCLFFVLSLCNHNPQHPQQKD